MDDSNTSTEKILQLPSNSAPSPPTPFQQPTLLCSFSYSPARELLFDDSALKYFVYPPQGADLSYRYQQWIKRPEERTRLDGLLNALMQEKCHGERERAGLITWRGIMTKIMTAPYEERDSWDLNVMCVRGVLYLEEHATPAQLAQKEGMDARQRLFTYYGYAFESFCTTSEPPTPATRPAWGGDVNTNVQWVGVVKTKVGSTRVLIGGEVDCVRDRFTGQPDTFVELKTSMTIRAGNPQDNSRFEKKLLKFYFQSFLLGTPEIVVGFRNNRGRVETLQTFRTLELPRMVRGKAGAWDPVKCLAWGKNVLEFLAANCGEKNEAGDSSEGERRVWRLTFTPTRGLRLRLLNETEVSEVRENEDRVGFLPRKYWDSVTSSQ